MKKIPEAIFILLITIAPAACAKEAVPIASSWQETLGRSATPQQIASLMKEHFKFEEDKKNFGEADYWQSPAELWSRGAGDCEDFAVFAQEALQRQKIEAYVVSIYGPRDYAHTFVIFKEKGAYQVMNETRLHYCHAASVEEAISRVRPDWIWGAVVRPKGRRGQSIRELRNASVPSAGENFTAFGL